MPTPSKQPKVSPLLGNEADHDGGGGETHPADVGGKLPPKPAAKPDRAPSTSGTPRREDFSQIADPVAQTKAILDASPHADFVITPNEGTRVGEYDTVQINGYKFKVRVGVVEHLPIQVIKILSDKYRIAMTAGQEKLLDRSADVSEALS
jgi:hypothetical protein